MSRLILGLEQGKAHQTIAKSNLFSWSVTCFSFRRLSSECSAQQNVPELPFIDSGGINYFRHT